MEPFSIGQLVCGSVAVVGAIIMGYQYYTGKPMRVSALMFIAGTIGFLFL